MFFRVGAGRCAAANRAHSAAQPGRGNGPEAMRLVKRTNALADAKSYEQATPLYSRRWTCGGNVRKWWEGARTTVELLSLEGSHVWGDVDPHGNGLGTYEANGGAVVLEVQYDSANLKS